ncbi:MAG: phage terminase large subunit, partial [Hyphomicrobiales bacterium]|nr:phage terminase large subunit [Hyphomicrobiales bacterium]
MAIRKIGEVRHRALPKQLQFLKAEEREVLYSGAFAAGKSRAVCLRLVLRASVPGAREGLCRKHLVTLKATTLKTLLEPDGDLPPVLPPGHYTHNKSDKVIRLRKGGEIQYFGLDDAAKIGSYNLSGCAVDEAVELLEEDWTQLRGRCRVRVKGLKNQLYGACNPGPPSHWLGVRFGLVPDSVCAPNCRAIQTKSVDNIFLRPSYLADLATFTGVAKLRYVDGLWVGSDQLVYPDWLRSVHFKERKAQWVRVVIGCDVGYNHPTAMEVVGLDGEDRAHVIEEWVERRKVEAEIIEAASQLVYRYHDSGVTIYIDPSAAMLRASMQEAGLPVEPADNDVKGGIQAVRDRLAMNAAGIPRLTVSPTCEKLALGMESYEHRRDRATGAMMDEVVKANDDECLAAGTLITTSRGEVSIESVAVGDMAWTRGGWRAVEGGRLTKRQAVTLVVTLSDGRKLQGTPTHKVWVDSFGWKPLKDLTPCDMLCVWPET